MNVITYKEIFPLLKENKMWLGPSITSGDREFVIPESVVDKNKFTGSTREGVYYQKVMGVRWFTSLDHGRRHEPLTLMTTADNLKFSKHKQIRGKASYDKYDNYDAIEVPFVDAIPSDYAGVMGVPISFLDKYCPEQFEIVSANDYKSNMKVRDKLHGLIKDKDGAINGVPTYVRILIKHRDPA
jgi:hypothetical protein